MPKSAKPKRAHACNIVQLQGAAPHLWSFSLGTDKAILVGETSLAPEAPLPDRTAKNLSSVWQRKVNVAWLPAQDVFIRAVDLPTGEAGEVQGMLELQLERLSPLPVNQIVWTYEVLPQPSPDRHSAIVIIAARSIVETFLGDLEQRRFLADRLELPVLHQLLATPMDEDGVWLYPSQEQSNGYCLVAWWFAGSLRNLALLRLPADTEWIKIVSDELSRAAWAGELEGWFKGALRCFIVADDATAATWEPVMRELSGQPVTIHPALDPTELAHVSALRLARSESRANLIPSEFVTRYRQQLIDGIWMRGLGAAAVVYIFILFGYFAWLEVREYKLGRLETQAAAFHPAYTNALQLQARIAVMEEQQNLRYAALDSWKAITEALPTELTLRRLTFRKGQTLEVSGIGAGDIAAKVTDYTESLGRIVINSNRLFARVNPKNTTVRPGELGPQTTTWSIECDLTRNGTK